VSNRRGCHTGSADTLDATCTFRHVPALIGQAFRLEPADFLKMQCSEDRPLGGFFVSTAARYDDIFRTGAQYKKCPSNFDQSRWPCIACEMAKFAAEQEMASSKINDLGSADGA
jgi:hypothetical protein